MLLAAGFIVAVFFLEAGPVYQLFMAGFRGRGLAVGQWRLMVVSFSLVLFLSLLAVWIPMRFGERRLRS